MNASLSIKESELAGREILGRRNNVIWDRQEWALTGQQEKKRAIQARPIQIGLGLVKSEGAEEEVEEWWI
ncbi:hypothetical protein VNO78_11450 [Psophocarpus tetragonolobus]|uniref:Uncharacterized protein n=1 Tax=Psophocarpus tetragonolobus TaxID=3891 RepID=A0AAN9SMF7_PSOTE